MLYDLLECPAIKRDRIEGIVAARAQRGTYNEGKLRLVATLCRHRRTYLQRNVERKGETNGYAPILQRPCLMARPFSASGEQTCGKKLSTFFFEPGQKRLAV